VNPDNSQRRGKGRSELTAARRMARIRRPDQFLFALHSIEDPTVDHENELARAKWFLVGIVLFLLSGCMSYQELAYLINGRETQADITKVYESRGCRGSTRLTVEYAFTEQDGKQRKAMDTVSTNWPVPPNGKVAVQYTPGEDGSSRLAGGVHWIWPAVFAFSLLCLLIIAVRLLREGAEEPKPRRRNR